MAGEESARRQIAFKVRISDIVNNRYVKEEGWLPNYIAVGDRKVSRVNLLGVIVSKDSQESDVVSQNYILDDGTGRVALRFFESATQFDVGDMVIVVGRPREFGTDRYIVPEIIRKLDDPKWVQVRKLELASEKHSPSAEKPPEAAPSGTEAVAEELSVETEDFVDDSNPLSDTISIIRQLDSGQGVGFEEIAAKSKSGNVEDSVSRLLEQGDIFEVKPGRYKVLE